MKKIIMVVFPMFLLVFLSACTVTVKETETGATVMDTVTETAKTEAEVKTNDLAVSSQPEPVYNTLSTADCPLPPDFIKYGAPCWFNDYEIVTDKNNTGAIGAAGLTIENKFA